MAKKEKEMKRAEKKVGTFGAVSGTRESTRAIEGQDSSRIRLKEGSNVFVWQTPAWCPEIVHYLPGEGENKIRSLCGAHSTGDVQLVADAKRWGSPDNCHICAAIQELREQKKAEKDRNPKLADALYEITKQAHAYSALFYVSQGDADSARGTGGKKIIKPYFDESVLRDAKILSLTDAQHQTFNAEFMQLDMDSEKAVGLVMNLERGKVKPKDRFTTLKEVTFFVNLTIPKSKLDPRIPLLPQIPDFPLGVYDEKKDKAGAERFMKMIPLLVKAEQKKSSANKKAAKKAD